MAADIGKRARPVWKASNCFTDCKNTGSAKIIPVMPKERIDIVITPEVNCLFRKQLAGKMIVEQIDFELDRVLETVAGLIAGFLVAAVGALLAPFSAAVGMVLGVGGVATECATQEADRGEGIVESLARFTRP